MKLTDHTLDGSSGEQARVVFDHAGNPVANIEQFKGQIVAGGSGVGINDFNRQVFK